MKKKTLVFGASLKSHRYSNIAINRLVYFKHEVLAFGLRGGEVAGVTIDTNLVEYKHIDTLTLYMNPKRQEEFYTYFLALKPKRVLFNPGTENPQLVALLKQNNIAYEYACTLVLLGTNQY